MTEAMDGRRALEWEARLKGTSIGGCRVESLIDHGKSAAVFRATRNDRPVALKIFDDEIIERYGDKTQLARIERELTLIGKAHPNMVQILDGGFDATTKNHFIVMEYLEGPNLQKCLLSVPEDSIPLLIGQLASCCEYLERLSLVHRDIKPSNVIILDNYSRLVLLDFGVLKPVGEIGVTDAGGVQSFVGTLQYSSPEFLLRREEDSIEGWRALSLYQVGGVLHDLIMRRPLFGEDANPYARLVNAVQNNTPGVFSTTVSPHLVEVCRAALVKDPGTRIKLVNWGSFRIPEKVTAGAAAREHVVKRSLLNDALATPVAASGSGNQDLVEVTVNLLKVEARRIRGENTAALPPLTVSRVPRSGSVVEIGFRPAPQQRLPTGVTLQLKVEVLDAASQAMELWACAFAAAGEAECQGTRWVAVYRGIFNPISIAAVLESSIYVAVDRAQTEAEGSRGAPLDLGNLSVD